MAEQLEQDNQITGSQDSIIVSEDNDLEKNEINTPDCSKNYGEKEKDVDKDSDPAEYAVYLSEKTAEENKLLKEQIDYNQQQILIKNAKDELLSLENSYKNDNHDYQDAKDFLAEIELKNLKTLYPESSEQELKTHIEEKILSSASLAAAAGKNPADIFYQTAKNYGYKTKEKSAPIPDLEIISKNSEKSKSLSVSGSRSFDPSSLPETVEEMLNLSQSELMALQEKIGRTKFIEHVKKLSSI